MEGTGSKWCRVAGSRESLPHVKEVTVSGDSKWEVTVSKWPVGRWSGDDRSHTQEFKQVLSRHSTWRQCTSPLG